MEDVALSRFGEKSMCHMEGLMVEMAGMGAVSSSAQMKVS